MPQFLTELCFGDFYTRRGLTLAQRELLILCALATIGDTAAQLGPHAKACIQVGNSTATVVAARVHCFPYIGFPRARGGRPSRQEPLGSPAQVSTMPPLATDAEEVQTQSLRSRKGSQLSQHLCSG